jgi:ribonuclease HII
MSQLIGGLDEVGWGSPAGPIVSVVVVMTEKDKLFLPKGVTDSKKLSEKRRDAFYLQLCAAATDVGMGCVEPWEIDSMGPKFALQESYTRALAELRHKPDLLITDGTDWTNKVRSWGGPQKVEPKADLNYVEVSAASIIAKVWRDLLMTLRDAELRKKGLDYNWRKNKGYLTPDHIQAIEKHGLLFGPEPEFYQHRRSYCANLLGKVPIYAASPSPTAAPGPGQVSGL